MGSRLTGVTDRCEHPRADGTPCTAAPVVGTTLCKTHGGKTGAKRLLNDRRRELREQEKELAMREKALVESRSVPVMNKQRQYALEYVGDDVDVDDPVQLSRWFAWRVTALAEAVGQVDGGSARHTALLQQAQKHTDSWERARTNERYVRITAAQAFGMMRAVDEALAEVVDDPDLADRIRFGVAESMRRAQRRLLEVDG